MKTEISEYPNVRKPRKFWNFSLLIIEKRKDLYIFFQNEEILLGCRVPLVAARQ